MKKTEINNDDLPKYSRRGWVSMAVFALFSGLGIFSWRWFLKQELDGGIRGGILTPLRKGLEINENIFTRFFSKARLVKEYPKDWAQKHFRVNSKIGLDNEANNIETYRLNIQKMDSKTIDISLADIKKLPKTEVIYNFKCIEGWSQISWWGGVRLADLLAHYQLEKEVAQKFIGLITPDTDYYVGMDMESALHPQTILAYERNGEPLSFDHGAPLRLIIPVKYGYKSLKQVGSIYFDNKKTDDYWVERGYDYYAGL